MIKKTLRLSNIDDNKNILLFTIASSESDIHLCLLINKIFKISLSLSEDLIGPFNSSSTGFRKYEYEKIEEEKFILIINRNSSGKILMPELKKIDYIFLIISEIPATSYDRRIQQLKEDNTITAIFKLDPVTVKSFSKLKL